MCVCGVVNLQQLIRGGVHIEKKVVQLRCSDID